MADEPSKELTIAWQYAQAAVDKGWRYRRPVLIHLWIECAGQVIHGPILAVDNDSMQLHTLTTALLTDASGLR